MIRRFETLDGKPFQGPLKVGQVVAVRLTLSLVQPREYVLIEDRRPAGCEFADDRIVPTLAGNLAHHEFRDDRICLFATSLSPGKHEIVYFLRAETPGTFLVLPGVTYPMYQDHLRGETGTNQLEIRKP